MVRKASLALRVQLISLAQALLNDYLSASFQQCAVLPGKMPACFDSHLMGSQLCIPTIMCGTQLSGCFAMHNFHTISQCGLKRKFHMWWWFKHFNFKELKLCVCKYGFPDCFFLLLCAILTYPNCVYIYWQILLCIFFSLLHLRCASS